MDEMVWARKSKVLTQWLAASAALNLGLLTSVIHRALKDSPRPSIEKPASAQLSATTAEILSHFFYLSFDDLVSKLADKRLVEDGYMVRDFALACLVGFHHFDCDRALPSALLQKRKLAFIHTEGGERVEVPILSALSDDRFRALTLFAQREKWPLTPEGLFLELKRTPSPPESLKETFLLTADFERFSSQLRLSAAESLAIALEGDFETLIARGDRPEILLLYVQKHRSLRAAQLLIDSERDFVVRRLEDGALITLLEVSKDKDLAREARLALRSDGVRLAAAQILGLTAVEPPLPLVRAAQPAEKLHVIQPGDSLWKIAKLYGVNVQALLEANQISSEEKLRPGRTVKIPGG